MTNDPHDEHNAPSLKGLFRPEQVSDPFPLYDRWREQSPVQTDDGSWLVLGYTEVMEALSDHRTFSSDLSHTSNPVLAKTPIIFEDPPAHTRHRALVQRSFTPSRIRAMTPWVQETVDRLVSCLPVGESDMIAALCDPLPVQVIAQLLGVPESEHAQFKAWSDERTYLVGTRDDVHDEASARRIANATAANDAMLGYFLEQSKARRADPTDDLISNLVADVGAELSDNQVSAICALVLTAGNVTTTNLLGNLLALFAHHPEAYHQVRADRTLVDAAVEEALRLESPVQWLYRTTTKDTVLGAAEIPSGARVIVYFGAANRDPRVFPEPEKFLLNRPQQRHMAFGHGIHFCLGAPLARLEANAVINRLADRFSSIEPGTATPRRIEDASTHCGYEFLPLKLGE